VLASVACHSESRPYDIKREICVTRKLVKNNVHDGSKLRDV
jgi:hypothetical protein